MSTVYQNEIESLKRQVKQLSEENALLKETASTGRCGLSNQAVDGIIFIVILCAVVAGVVIWLSSMPG